VGLGDIEMWGQPPMAWSDSSQQRFIQIDISGDLIGLNRQVDIGIVGDAKSTLRAILETIEKYTSKKEERESLQVYKQVEKSWLEEYAKKVGLKSTRKYLAQTAYPFILCN
jgi:thiamine pyrophosphate-dependent acetolactate synthase large subunit-like protein